ncbi:MAG: nucleotide exchange factor GrpE [Myxococcaceae bacterium]
MHGNDAQSSHEDEASTEAPAAQPGEEVEALTAKLDAAYRRIDELARAVQEGERDRQAFKDRLTRERERMLDVEKGNVALTLLEAVDELDLCLHSADESPLAKGVRMIRENILQKLANLGFERMALAGQPFDPNLAEAMDMEVTTNPSDDHKVVQELRAGYRMKERVLRPARVKVARYFKPAEA